MRKYYFVLLLLASIMLSSCVTFAPKGFVKAADGGTWSTVLLRDGLTYDPAYGEVLDVVAKRFEMDMISKDGAYARTNWSYTWNTKSKYNEKYRTRVIFKFSGDKTKVDIKTEAEFGGESRWIKGYDTRLLQTIKQDISGAVGRTVM